MVIKKRFDGLDFNVDGAAVAKGFLTEKSHKLLLMVLGEDDLIKANFAPPSSHNWVVRLCPPLIDLQKFSHFLWARLHASQSFSFMGGSFSGEHGQLVRLFCMVKGQQRWRI